MKKFLLPILFLLSITGYSQSSELTVIGNNKGVPAQLSTSNLKSIFMGNQPKWSDGSKVVIAMMKFTTEGGKSTCSKLYQKSTTDVTKHWLTVSMIFLIQPLSCKTSLPIPLVQLEFLMELLLPQLQRQF